MSKEASVIQKYNAEKREYEYFVKGYDITESIKNLLKLHKEAYDKENHSILESKGFIEAQNIYLPQIEKLEYRLSNCIEPKFKIGQEVLVNDWTGQLRSGEIFEIQTNQVKFDQVPLITYLVDYGAYSDDDQENDYFEEKDVFVTEEEARKRLEELKGE